MKKALNSATESAPQKQEQENNILKIEEPKRNFIIVYDSVYKDNLSASALALLIKLISLAPTFKPTTDKLATILKIGRTQTKQAIKELKNKGFLKIKINCGKQANEWQITQEPKIEIIAKNYNDEEIQQYFFKGQISYEDLYIMYKKHLITKERYNKILDETYRIAKLNIYKDE